MKRMRTILKGNHGASLIAVIVAIMFITAIGGIITQITMTNIRMKEIESSGKVNFYSAEKVVDDLSSGLNSKASVAMKDAYIETLSDYRNVMVAGSNVQKDFSVRYLTRLKELFANSDTPTYIRKDPSDVTSELVFESGKCDFDTVKACLTDNTTSLIKDADKIDYELDYVEEVFILKNIHMTYIDKGYETNIHTDMVFHTPVLNFSGSNMIMDFMRYSLIADDQINVSAGATQVVVDGNVYAGVNGILCNSTPEASKIVEAGPGKDADNLARAALLKDGNVTDDSLKCPKFIGKMIVTRGKIDAGLNSSWIVGSPSSKIWAGDIEANGKNSDLRLFGNIYVEDDLALNAKNSAISIYGNYYGYNFQKEYDALQTGLHSDAAFSSAMLINARNSKLDLSNVQYLMLAGRTYISRKGGSTLDGNPVNKDIPMGESISVRSNQMAYFVPTAFVDTTTCMFREEGGEKTGLIECAKYMGVNVSDIENNVNSAANVTAYKYLDDGEKTIYYLNFKNENSANAFFAAYANGYWKDKVETYAEDYVHDDALILGSNTLYTLKGDLLYRDGTTKKLKEQKIDLTSAQTFWNEGGIYWNHIKKLAQSYKALQTSLEQYPISVPEKVRIYDASNNVSKSASPLIYNLLKVSDLINSIPGDNPNDKSYIDSSDGIDETVILRKGNLTLDSTYTGGIAIVDGDVTITGTFDGMVMATGKITLCSNAKLTANETKVSRMFTKDMNRKNASGSDSKFSQYFINFNNFTESVIGEIKVSDFLSYDNWTKTEEN